MVLSLSYVFYRSHRTIPQKNEIKNSASVQQIISYPDGKKASHSYTLVKDETALSLLSRTQKIEVKTYSFGTLVESIDGIKNGNENKYWLFYVNAKESKMGAGDYKLQPNDTVEWRYQAYEQ